MLMQGLARASLVHIGLTLYRSAHRAILRALCSTLSVSVVTACMLILVALARLGPACVHSPLARAASTQVSRPHSEDDDRPSQLRARSLPTVVAAPSACVSARGPRQDGARSVCARCLTPLLACVAAADLSLPP